MSLVGSTSLVRVKFIGIFANFAHTAEPDFVMKREKWEKNKNRDLKNSVVIAFFPISIKNILNLSQFILCLWYNFLQPFIRLPATITCNYPPPHRLTFFFFILFITNVFHCVVGSKFIICCLISAVSFSSGYIRAIFLYKYNLCLFPFV